MFRNPDAPRILIIRLSAIGDCVMASPVAELLRQRHPNAYIAWAVQEKSRGVVEGNPFVDEVIVWRKGRGELRRLLQTVRARRFDVALELQGLLKSTLLMAASGAPRRLVSPRFGRLSRLLATETVSHPPGYVYPPERYVCWAAQLGAKTDQWQLTVPTSEADHEAARLLLEESGVRERDVLVALNPGCSAPSRKWPVEKFARAAELVSKAHPDVKFVALGGPQDREDAALLSATLGEKCVVAAGALSLRGTAALLARCAAVVTNDTGPMHIAVAVKTPVVGIFGPIAARRRLPANGPHIGLERRDVCQTLGRPQCAGHPSCACLNSVTPVDVAAAVGRIVVARQAVSARSDAKQRDAANRVPASS